MRLRTWSVLLLLPVFSVLATAEVKIGASVINVQLDTDKNTATIHIQNGSSKDISAYVISVDITYANGQTSHSELLVDLLPLMMTNHEQSAAAPLSEGAFRAGEARGEVATFSSDPSNPATKANAELMAVVYSDRTADVRSSEALTRVLTVRRGVALARQESADIIRKAVDDPSEAHPAAAAAAAIQQLLLRSKAAHSGELQTELLSAIDDMQRAPDVSVQLGVSERDYLNRWIAKSVQRASTALSHTEIRRGQ